MLFWTNRNEHWVSLTWVNKWKHLIMLLYVLSRLKLFIDFIFKFFLSPNFCVWVLCVYVIFILYNEHPNFSVDMPFVWYQIECCQNETENEVTTTTEIEIDWNHERYILWITGLVVFFFATLTTIKLEGSENKHSKQSTFLHFWNAFIEISSSECTFDCLECLTFVRFSQIKHNSRWSHTQRERETDNKND